MAVGISNLKLQKNYYINTNNLCETNDPINFKEKINKKFLDINEISKRIELGEDIIGRKDNFSKIELDKTFPDYLLDNIEKDHEWIQL